MAADVLGQAGAAAQAAQAARLAKADLATDMVREFTELQGTMGGIYAREDGEPEAVWKAIYYHYLPIGVEADAPPSRAAARRGGGDVGGRVAGRQARHARRAVRSPASGRPARAIRSACGGRRTGVVRILMDLPELTGIDRELGARRAARARG